MAFVNASVRKGFFFDSDYLMVALLFLLVLFSAKGFAFSVDVPQSIEVSNSSFFYATITNTSDESVPLIVNFFSPLKSTVSVPSTIAPNSSVQAKVTLSNNNFKNGNSVSSTLEANFGGTIVQKQIILNFTNSKSDSGILSSAFSFASFFLEVNSFNLFDWIIFWVLVIVAAVLLVSFIARVRKRA